jgi:hypothetical protein
MKWAGPKFPRMYLFGNHQLPAPEVDSFERKRLDFDRT